MAHKQRPVIMTPQDKLKVIAEYDGWTFHDWEKNGLKFCSKYFGNRYEQISVPELKYLTSLDWLHPVAMKVADVICVSILSSRGSKRIECKKLIKEIESACFCRAVNGEYTALFNAVYEGIEFLNQNKPTA
jgi:hypothetical protein